MTISLLSYKDWTDFWNNSKIDAGYFQLEKTKQKEQQNQLMEINTKRVSYFVTNFYNYKHNWKIQDKTYWKK